MLLQGLVPGQSLDGVRPWVAFTQASLTWLPKGGTSLDGFFLGEARARKLPVINLETPAEQFDALDAAHPPDVVKMAVGELDAIKARHRASVDAYLAGDPEGMGASDDPSVVARYKVHYDHLFTRRNAAWLEKLVPSDGSVGLVRPDADLFIAVGAGHLTSVDNLVTALRARGFTLTRLGTPEAAPASSSSAAAVSSASRDPAPSAEASARAPVR